MAPGSRELCRLVGSCRVLIRSSTPTSSVISSVLASCCAPAGSVTLTYLSLAWHLSVSKKAPIRSIWSSVIGLLRRSTDVSDRFCARLRKRSTPEISLLERSRALRVQCGLLSAATMLSSFESTRLLDARQSFVKLGHMPLSTWSKSCGEPRAPRLTPFKSSVRSDEVLHACMSSSTLPPSAPWPGLRRRLSISSFSEMSSATKVHIALSSSSRRNSVAEEVPSLLRDGHRSTRDTLVEPLRLCRSSLILRARLGSCVSIFSR